MFALGVEAELFEVAGDEHHVGAECVDELSGGVLIDGYAAAIAGVVAIVLAGLTLWILFRFTAGSRWLGRVADRVVNWVRHFFGKAPTDRIERSLTDFKSQTAHIVRHRGWLLTGTTLANQLVGFVLVLIIVRAVGITTGQVTVIAVFTSFAVARLAGAIPITPGGLGTLDAAFLSLMTAFGASSSRALAADLIWRLTVYFLPIIPGIVTYLIWLRARDPDAHRGTSEEGKGAVLVPGADVLAEHAYFRVALHLVAQRLVQRLGIGELGHEATPARATSPLAYR